MKYLHPYLYEIIHDLVAERMEQKRIPCVAIENDIYHRIRADVEASLKEMKADGLINRSENINGIGLFRPLKERNQDEDNNVQ